MATSRVSHDGGGTIREFEAGGTMSVHMEAEKHRMCQGMARKWA